MLSEAIALPALMGAIFGLGPLFVVAGWFSARSLARRGPAGFLRGRLLRLGVPVVVFVLVVNPLADWLGDRFDQRRGLLEDLGDTEFSVMWFVLALLACSTGYAVLRAVRPLRGSRRRPGAGSLVVAAAVTAGVSLAVWQVTTLLDTHLLNARVAAWTQGAVLFALGVRAAEAGWDGRLPRPVERRLGLVAAVGLPLTAALLAVMALRDRLDSAMSEPGPVSVSFALLYGVVSVSFSLWRLAWARRRWPSHGRLMARAGRGSYATYLLHPVVLVSVMLAFRAVPVGPQLKFVLVAVVGVPVCFAVGYAVTRVPGVRRVV